MNKNKIKGSIFEKLVSGFLKEYGFPAERRVQGGTLDKGDIAGVDNWVLECKSVKKFDLAGFIDEARKEAQNAKAKYFAAIIKRRQKPASKAFVLMELDQFAEIIQQLAKVPPKSTPERKITRDRGTKETPKKKA